MDISGLKNQLANDVRLKLQRDIKKTRESLEFDEPLVELFGMLQGMVPEEKQDKNAEIAFQMCKLNISQNKVRLAKLNELQQQYYPEDVDRDYFSNN